MKSTLLWVENPSLDYQKSQVRWFKSCPCCSQLGNAGLLICSIHYFSSVQFLNTTLVMCDMFDFGDLSASSPTFMVPIFPIVQDLVLELNTALTGSLSVFVFSANSQMLACYHMKQNCSSTFAPILIPSNKRFHTESSAQMITPWKFQVKSIASSFGLQIPPPLMPSSMLKWINRSWFPSPSFLLMSL